jgi:hypothetical protein
LASIIRSATLLLRSPSLKPQDERDRGVEVVSVVNRLVDVLEADLVDGFATRAR